MTPDVAMVLAAGRGERLRPLTESIAKPALHFCGTPILTRLLDSLGEIGIAQAIVNRHHAPDSVARVVEDRGTAPPRVSFSDETDELLGTAGALIPVVETLRGGGPFFLLNGDCVHSIDLAELARAHARSHASATLAVLPRPEPGFGCLRVEGETVVEFGGPATGRDGEVHYLSAMIVEPALLDFLPTRRRPFSTFAEWFPAARVAGHRFAAWQTEAEWHALDTRERYVKAMRDWLRRRGNEAHVDPTADVAPDASVDASSAVHADCVVEAGAEIRSSALLPGARVESGATVVGSIVGPGATVTAGDAVIDSVIAA